MFSNLLLSMPGGSEWLIVLVGLAFLIFWIYTIVDVARNKFSDDTTKIVWLLVVIFLGLLGSLLYWIFGRSNRVVVNEN